MIRNTRALWIVMLFVAGAVGAEESFNANGELIYLPDAAATEAARKGERLAKRIQQRRKERGTAGKIKVDFEPRIATARRKPPSTKRGSFVQSVIDAFSNPSVSLHPRLTRKSIGLKLILKFGEDEAGHDDDLFAREDEGSVKPERKREKDLRKRR